MVQNTTDNSSSGVSSQVSEPVAFDAKKIWWVLAPKLLNLVVITTLLTGAGFFVIHSYLATVTRMFTFNISVTQYVAAGINMVLGLSGYALLLLLSTLSYAILFVGAGIVLFLIGYLCVTRSKRIHELWDKFRTWWLPIYHRLHPVVQVVWFLYKVAVGLLFIGVMILLGLVWGTSYYAQSPRMIGGGMPSEVILLFREDQPTKSPIWGFPINTATPRQSEPVQLLIELTDGIIVRDAATDRTTIVKNDVLQGIVDAYTTSSNLTNVPTATTQPSGTPTP